MGGKPANGGKIREENMNIKRKIQNKTKWQEQGALRSQFCGTPLAMALAGACSSLPVGLHYLVLVSCGQDFVSLKQDLHKHVTEYGHEAVDWATLL